MLLFTIALRDLFVPYPWRTTPDPSDNFHRFLCRGWHCAATEYHAHQTEEFNSLVNGYANGTVTTNFTQRIEALIQRGYDPAQCMAGFFELFGIAGFAQNFTSAYARLTAGAAHDLWSCYEALSFHPNVSDSFEYIEKAANLGGVWSMIQLGLRTRNQSESLKLFRHLATSMTSGWWKKRRSGQEYASAVGTILSLDDGDLNGSWQKIETLAVNGHLPAALWMAEGLETGEIGRKNITEAIELLKGFVVRSAWVIDLEALLEAENIFDRVALFKVAAKLGNPSVDYLLSYPSFFGETVVTIRP
jgi:hypothetical protein